MERNAIRWGPGWRDENAILPIIDAVLNGKK